MSDSKSVLIVDDEAPIREMIAVALEMAGYNCLEAENANEAHSLIVDDKPDMVLLDWMMPGTSGIEFARRLRKDETTADLPIIMLTAKGDEDYKIKGLEAGVDDYITKPFSPRELVASPYNPERDRGTCQCRWFNTGPDFAPRHLGTGPN